MIITCRFCATTENVIFEMYQSMVAQQYTVSRKRILLEDKKIGDDQKQMYRA